MENGQVQLVAFSWCHDPGGYRLDKAKKGPRGWTPDTLWLPGTELVKSQTGEAVDYTPDPADPIHRKFAMVGDEPASLVAFAEEYGLPTTRGPTESIVDLIRARDRVRAVLAAVDKANTAQGAAAIKHMMSAEKIWSERERPKLTMTFVPRLLNGVTATVALKAVPATLLDYMLLQAAFELQGQAAWRECSVCGKLMPIGPKHGRRHRDTCSNACRQAKYQRKKELRDA